jgi:hypothetical protein
MPLRARKRGISDARDHATAPILWLRFHFLDEVTAAGIAARDRVVTRVKRPDSV